MAWKSVNTKSVVETVPDNWHHVSERLDDEVVNRPFWYMCEEQHVKHDNSDKAWVLTYPEFLNPVRWGVHGVANHVMMEVFYDRVWVDPQIIYAGFILYDIPDTVVVWNAFIDKSIDITAMTTTGADGTTLDYTVPQTLNPLGAALWDLVVLKKGPPTQDAYYYPTVDGTQYTIHVYGVRLLTIAPEPNWESPPSVAIEFSTVVSSTERFKEQRRPLYPNPVRSIAAQYLIDNVDAQIFFNTLSYGHDKVIGVPIYNEQMQSSDLSVGVGVITVNESHEYLWNLHNNCEYIGLTDHVNGIVEVIEIDSLASNTTITLVSNITASFDENSTVIYPIVVSTLKAVRMNTTTDLLEVINVDFMEYTSG